MIRYEGEFVDGKKEGKGKYYCHNGDFYDGEYKKDKGKEKVFSFLKEEINMKENLKIIISKVKANIYIKMEINMKEIFIKISFMEKVLFISKMEINMKEIGKMT